jgi:hypothetical protein
VQGNQVAKGLVHVESKGVEYFSHYESPFNAWA